jgi:hypothetical protein
MLCPQRPSPCPLKRDEAVDELGSVGRGSRVTGSASARLRNRPGRRRHHSRHVGANEQIFWRVRYRGSGANERRKFQAHSDMDFVRSLVCIETDHQGTHITAHHRTCNAAGFVSGENNTRIGGSRRSNRNQRSVIDGNTGLQYIVHVKSD